MKWPLTFFTDKFLPKGTGGRAIGPVILLRPKYKGTDEGIYQHEVVHVKQWFTISAIACGLLYLIHPVLTPAGIGVFGLLYMLIPEVRLWSEVQAFKKQAEYYPDDRIPLFAAAIATRYNLKISKENAEKLLRG